MVSPLDCILVVDDNIDVLESLRDVLGHRYDVTTASSGQEAIVALEQKQTFSAVIMDIKMAGRDGISTAREIRRVQPDLPIIFHTGYPGEYHQEELDVTESPYDFVLKSEPIPRLLRAVKNAVEICRLRVSRSGGGVANGLDLGMIGTSKVMNEVFARVRLAAVSSSKVMILGETGTGKELVARAIHNRSPVSTARFAILNCNHKSPDLVESELFGHLKGSFTSASGDRQGLFEYADGGTVFLDEIGDLDITTQAKLLRVLDTGEYSPIGTNELSKCSVRLVCATHRDLEKLVQEGRFRQDLFYRLKGVKIELPPLRQRKEDIPLLAENFIERMTVGVARGPKLLDPSALDALVEYNWPGNVRQLLETIDSLVTLTVSDVIFGDDVTAALDVKQADTQRTDASFATQVRDFEKSLIIKTLARFDQNVSRAAAHLGLDRANLARKIKSLGL